MEHLFSIVMVLIFVAAFAGLIAGLFGVGGGLILVPAFVYAFEATGFDHARLIQIAIATSLATIIFTSVRSTLSHHKKGAVDWHILKAWALSIAIGAVAAVYFMSGIRPKTLTLAFGVLALVISFVMFFGVGRVQIADQMPKGPKAWGLGALTGFFSTLMGIGGGSIAVPIMVMHGRPIHNAVATASGFGALIAVPSVVAFLFANVDPNLRPPGTIGYVNIPAFLIVIAVTYFTAPIGAKIAHRLNAAKLKKYFAVFIAIVALNMVRKALM